MTVILFDLSKRTTNELRHAVEEGGDVDLPRGTAIQELLRRDYPFKFRTIRKAVADETEELTTRLLAVSALARLGGAEAREALLDTMRSEQLRLRLEAVWALGRIGESEDVERIRRLSGGCALAEQEQAAIAFAEFLIGLRAGGVAALPIDLHDELYTPLCNCTPLSISVRRASSEQVENGVWSLGDEGFGVDPTEDSAFSLDLEGSNWLVAFDRTSIPRLTQPSTGSFASVLGIISEEDPQQPGDFFLSSVLLVERNRHGGRVAGVDRQGSLALFGSLDESKSRTYVHLRAVAKPEWPPVELDIELLPDGSARFIRAEIAPGLTKKVRLKSVTGPGQAETAH
jgi:hypothetical protein